MRTLLMFLLFLPAAHARDMSFTVSPSTGMATISNMDGYDDAPFLRIYGGFHPLPQLGLYAFGVDYADFDSNRGSNNVTIKVNGFGVGVMGRWPAHRHVGPYIRADYFRWYAELEALGRTLAKDNGGSPGLAVGIQFPIWRMIGVNAEFAGYNDVSGADLRQASVGVKFEF